jgi:hypothetical protein
MHNGEFMAVHKSNLLFFLLVCIALILAAYTVLTTSVTYLDSTDWGLLSRLPVSYWLGMLTIGFAVVFSLRSNSTLTTQASLSLLILILLYLTFIPLFIEKPVGLSPFLYGRPRWQIGWLKLDIFLSVDPL